MPPARAPSSCSSAWPTSRARCANGAAGCSSATDRRSGSCPSWPARSGSKRFTSRADVGPFARGARGQVRAALGQAGMAAVAHPGLFAVDHLEPIRTGAGDPYTVFTPFYRNWLSQPRREVLGAPRRLGLRAAGRGRAACPSSPISASNRSCSDPTPGGERLGARRCADSWLAPSSDYSEGRDALTGEGVSRLSPYLHFGCLSPREIEERLPGGEGADAFRRQLCWRDFYAHVLGHFPANAHSEYPGALSRDDPLEPRRAALRRLVRGTDRIPGRRRRDAPAAAGGVDAQSGSARWSARF